MTEALHPWLQGFLARIEQGALPTPHWPDSLSDSDLYRLWHSQLCSRLLDLQSRLLQAKGQNQQLSLQLPKEWLEQQPLLVADLQQEQLHLKKIAFVLDCPYLVECSLQSPGFDPSSLDEE